MEPAEVGEEDEDEDDEDVVRLCAVAHCGNSSVCVCASGKGVPVNRVQRVQHVPRLSAPASATPPAIT